MKVIKKILTFLPMMILFAGCSGISGTDDSKYENTGSLLLNVKDSFLKVQNTASSSDRVVFTGNLSSALVTVTSSDFTGNYSTTVDLSSGSGTGEITGIPAGKNRVITVQAYNNSSAMSNIVIRTVMNISSEVKNSADVSWMTTGLGNVYAYLLSQGQKIADFSDSENEKIKNAVDLTVNGSLIDYSSLGDDYISGSLKSSSSYILEKGTLSFTFYYPVENFTAWFSDPVSSKITECKPGKEITISDCAPGSWILYIMDSTGTILSTENAVTINAGGTTAKGVISYDGVMAVVNATTYSAYKNLYVFNYNGAGDSVAYNSMTYPGTEMTQYGDFYIQAFPSVSVVNLICNKGSSDSDKLYADDLKLTSKGIYLLTSDSPGYTVLAEGKSSSGSSEDTPDESAFDNKIWLKFSSSKNTWAVSETGTETEITVDSTKINSAQKIKIKYTEPEDAEGTSTGCIKLDLSNSTSNTAIYLSGTSDTSLFGGLKIQTNPSYDVLVYLNGVNLTSTNYPCIEITKGGKAYIYVSGTNVLKDGRSYGTGYGAEYSTTSGDTYTDDDGNTADCTLSKAVVKEGSDSKGTLYCKGDMILSGSGNLTLTESYKNCIASKGYLTVNGGTYNLTSNAKNGFDALYGFTQNGGDITFTGNGGIVLYGSSSSGGMGGNRPGSGSSSSGSTATDVTQTYVHKTSGIVVDGIISTYDNGWIKITGGSYKCTAKYGKGMNAKWDSSSDTDNDGTCTSGQADPSIYISGGDITIDVTGTGYTNDDRKTGSYYDADGVLVSSSSSSSSSSFGMGGMGGMGGSSSTGDYICAAAEGIEAAKVIEISGGSTAITADDDGINMSLTGGNINITGGNVFVYTPKGDGIDSNGNVVISGGNIVSIAPTGSEDALDCGDGGYSVTISNATIACLAGKSCSASGSSKVLNSSGSVSLSSSGTALIKDSSGNCLYAFKSPLSTSVSGYLTVVSPNLTGSSYTVYTAGTIGSGGTSFQGLYYATSLPAVSSYGSSTTTVK